MPYILHPIHADFVECTIARELIRILLGCGYLVSVYDGEETTVRDSTDYNKVLEAMGSTDSDLVRFRSADNADRGSFLLIWGNGVDVISDSSVNEATDRVLSGVEDMINYHIVC